MRRREYITAATIRRGKLRVSNPQRWIDAMRSFRDGAVLINVKTATATRSTAANAAYWAGYVRPLSDYTGYDPYTMHTYLKHRFLAREHLIIAGVNGEVVDEREIERATTTTLSQGEFADYLDRIAAFASDLGVTVGQRNQPKDPTMTLNS